MTNPIESAIPRVSVRDMNFRSAASRGRQTFTPEAGEFQQALAATSEPAPAKETATAPATKPVSHPALFSQPTPATLAKTEAAKAETKTAAPAASEPAAAATSDSTATSGYTMNVFDRESVEQWMNTWLIGQIHHQNAARMEIHNQAMENWKLNDANCRALGIQPPSQPVAPVETPAEPMPSGWWFANNA